MVKRVLRWGRVHVNTLGKTAGIVCHPRRQGDTGSFSETLMTLKIKKADEAPSGE